jgi:hypothetical protein
MMTADVRSAAFGHGWKLDRWSWGTRAVLERGDQCIHYRKGQPARAYRGNALTAILRTPAQLAEFLRTEPAGDAEATA